MEADELRERWLNPDDDAEEDDVPDSWKQDGGENEITYRGKKS